MVLNFSTTTYPVSRQSSDWFRGNSKGRERILLREAERCKQCGKEFQSLYVLKRCKDHSDMVEL